MNRNQVEGNVANVLGAMQREAGLDNWGAQHWRALELAQDALVG